MSGFGLFQPLLVMVALAFVVMFRMAFMRVNQLRRDRIHPQRVATSVQMAATVADTRAADNFRNLFELPVLFYAAVLVAHGSGQTGGLVVGLAWTFVVLRCVHSAIHCTYNRVTHRFAVFMAGALALILLWIVLAVRLWS